MSCCAPGAAIGAAASGPSIIGRHEVILASRRLGDGTCQTDASVPQAHCAGCIATIEGALLRLEGVISARVNLTGKRVVVRWRDGALPPPILETLAAAGFEATLTDTSVEGGDPAFSRILRALALAGFASMNIMMLSVSIWSGSDVQTRNAFHVISGILALPTIIYSGSIFFESAWRALRTGRTNMDVPISVGIILAFGLSVFDTLVGRPHAYFDAVTSLLFFLLAGRAADHAMRGRARDAVRSLARLMPRGATVVMPNGEHEHREVAAIEKGDAVLVLAGERVPVDGTVLSGRASLDLSVVSGESLPERVEPGSEILSGSLSLDGALTVRVDRAAKDSFLSDMARLMEAAEDGRLRYRRIADRAASLYSPVVHLLALATFAAWIAFGADVHSSLTVAISVLIITCPCALGLAVPMVQAVAARRLFSAGITLKDGAALERLSEVDHVAFDKTGVLTFGLPVVVAASLPKEELERAASLARHSRHPISRAVAGLLPDARHAVHRVQEEPGSGIEGLISGKVYRLGRPAWAAGPSAIGGPGRVCLTADGRELGAFTFSDAVRPGAADAVRRLHGMGIGAEIISGDAAERVRTVATAVGLDQATAEVLPRGKVERLETLRRTGRRVLMVGDGLNDAPALGAAFVSMAPATAADIGRNAADLVFLGSSLNSVPIAIRIARKARSLVRQNIALSIGYNALALPLAVSGHVTPLIAAIAMSTSSILVIANALRLSGGKPKASVHPQREPSKPMVPAE